MSFLTHGVDSRTGQYSMRLELPCARQWPEGYRLSLVMLFNSMSNQDTGYGTNWQLQHTRFTPADSMLTLASGETYKVTADDPETGQLLMREKKLDSFHLYRHGDGYRIVHRSGLVEVLGLEGSGSNRAFVPKQVVSPLGHVLRLRYEHVSGGFMRLKAIHQADGEPVFSTELDIDNILSLNYFPDALGGPGASYKMHLTGAERTVKKIELPSHDQGAWDFDYQQLQGLWCMQRSPRPMVARSKYCISTRGTSIHSRTVTARRLWGKSPCHPPSGYTRPWATGNRHSIYLPKRPRRPEAIQLPRLHPGH